MQDIPAFVCDENLLPTREGFVPLNKPSTGGSKLDVYFIGTEWVATSTLGSELFKKGQKHKVYADQAVFKVGQHGGPLAEYLAAAASLLLYKNGSAITKTEIVLARERPGEERVVAVDARQFASKKALVLGRATLADSATTAQILQRARHTSDPDAKVYRAELTAACLTQMRASKDPESGLVAAGSGYLVADFAELPQHPSKSSNNYPATHSTPEHPMPATATPDAFPDATPYAYPTHVASVLPSQAGTQASPVPTMSSPVTAPSAAAAINPAPSSGNSLELVAAQGFAMEFKYDVTTTGECEAVADNRWLLQRFACGRGTFKYTFNQTGSRKVVIRQVGSTQEQAALTVDVPSSK